MKLSAIILSAALTLCPVTIWAQATGAQAFSQRDFATAEQLWSQEAANGSAEAMLGLGLLADRGYNGRRNFGVAFDWYAKAADLGLAEAQFNIAVMYDAGLGRERDAAKALTWYTRAALRDYPRAQYNLGLLYESGDGIHPNADLAQHWFDKAAANLPAAAAKSVVSTTTPMITAQPVVLFSDATTRSVELVWSAPVAANPFYMLEVMQAPEFDTDYQALLMTLQTDSSGLLLQDIAVQENTVWRVVNLSADASDYAASQWQNISDQGNPKGRVTLIVDNAIPAMQIAAAIFADDLRTAGYWVRLRTEGAPARSTGTTVIYRYEADRKMAELVASYLPGPTNGKPVLAQPEGNQPSEITVVFDASR